MANKEKALVRIQKLLALSTSPNEHEAKEALLMAQKLMAKYGMTLEQAQVDNEEIEYANISVEAKNHSFSIPLATIISKNFRCKVYLYGGDITFYGHAEDCKICCEVFNFAYKEIIRLGNNAYYRAKSNYYNTVGFFTNYRNAFLYSLKCELEKQCTALMLITPQDVEDNFSSMMEGSKQKRVTQRQAKQNAYAVTCGLKDGKAFANSNIK